MKVKESIEIMKAHNAWRRGNTADVHDVKKIGIAIDTLVKLAESLKITDDSPIVGRRYKQHATGIIGEVKVIGIGGGHVIYRMARKGFGAQLCACNDFLMHFDLIENEK